MAIGPQFSSSIFSRISAAKSRLQFEEQFRLMQSTIINRINEKISAVNNDANADRKLERLDTSLGKLRGEITTLTQYIFDNKSNFDKLADLNTEQAALRALLKSDADGDLDNVTATEADDFNANKAALVENLLNMEELYHPNINDSNPIKPLRDLANDLDALTAEAGVVDAAGSDSPTNDNRAIYDILDEINDKISSAIFVTEGTIYTAHSFRESANKKVAATQAEQIEITYVDAQKRAEEIEKIRTEYSHLLTAMSLSYENSAQANQTITDRLSPQTPAPGSILNIFS